MDQISQLDSYFSEDYKASLLTGGFFGILGLFLFDMGPSFHPGISSDKGGLIAFEYLVYHYLKVELHFTSMAFEF